MTGTLDNPWLIRVSHLRKSYDGRPALQDVNLELKRGEVLALIGGNGAGKSSLVRVLTGVESPDGGTISLSASLKGMCGRKYDLSRLTVKDARAAGIAVVHQAHPFAEHLDIASNVFLGNEPMKWKFFIDRPKMIADTAHLLTRLGLQLPPTGLTVDRLSGGQRQSLAVARALTFGGEVLILDEPVASLDITESMKVLRLINRLRNRGTSILLVTRNIGAVYRIADRAVRLERGVTGEIHNVRGLDRDKLTECLSRPV